MRFVADRIREAHLMMCFCFLYALTDVGEGSQDFLCLLFPVEVLQCVVSGLREWRKVL